MFTLSIPLYKASNFTKLKSNCFIVVLLSKLQLKVLMGVTADVDIEIADNLGNYETELFANELNQYLQLNLDNVTALPAEITFG